MSYGPNYSDQFRPTGELVDKILRGAKPGDIPVEQPTKFDLTIDMVTPKALGITVPRMLLGRADEVIEWRRCFSAVRSDVNGTKQTCRLQCAMSALGGKAENISSQ
jgi:hypothetical protein